MVIEGDALPGRPLLFVKLHEVVLRRADVPMVARVLFCVLVDRMRGRNECRVSRRQLAEAIGVSRATVDRAVPTLVAKGWIVARAGPWIGRRADRVTTFRFGPAAPNGLEPMPSHAIERSRNGAVAACERPQNEAVDGADTMPSTASLRGNHQTKTTELDTQKAHGRHRDLWAEACEAMTGDALRTDQFAAAWRRWCECRHELRKPLTPTTVRAQIRQLEAWGESVACEAIQRSILAGWQGLFDPRQNARADDKRRPRATPKLAERVDPLPLL